MKIEKRKVAELIPYVNNSRTHSDEQIAQIAASITEFGWTNPILIDEKNSIIAGHGRLLAARKLGHLEVPTIQLKDLTEAQKKAYVIADNKLALNAGWDATLLKLELENLQELGFDLDMLGFNPDDLAALIDPEQIDEPKGQAAKLSDRFLIPPFSVLNAREGWWQERKRNWLVLGIKSEEGRNAPAGGSPDLLARQRGESGTSIFDPVLCELIYRWFSPKEGLVLDPFAGGSVRGIVASKLNRKYIGHELRQEQVSANRSQGSEICGEDQSPPAWICGDSRNIDKTCADVEADLIFSCPPYADLEVYSDSPQDLSTLSYQEFRAAYFEIIAKACGRLKNDRFACFVVGEVRDKRGYYYDFVGDTVEAFCSAGLQFYNEAILVTPSGSVALRAGKQFSVSRKMGKTHQNVLIFIKGDGKKAAKACGDVQIEDEVLNAVAGAESSDAV